MKRVSTTSSSSENACASWSQVITQEDWLLHPANVWYQKHLCCWCSELNQHRRQFFSPGTLPTHILLSSTAPHAHRALWTGTKAGKAQLLHRSALWTPTCIPSLPGTCSHTGNCSVLQTMLCWTSTPLNFITQAKIHFGKTCQHSSKIIPAAKMHRLIVPRPCSHPTPNIQDPAKCPCAQLSILCALLPSHFYFTQMKNKNPLLSKSLENFYEIVMLPIYVEKAPNPQAVCRCSSQGDAADAAQHKQSEREMLLWWGAIKKKWEGLPLV